MAVSTSNTTKKNTSGDAGSNKTPLPKWLAKKPLAKQVLAHPSVGAWPTFGKKATIQVTKAFVECVGTKTDVGFLKPPWKELRKVERKLRSQAVAKYRSEALSKLPLEKREALLQSLATEKDQLAHVFIGYNQIMRALQRDEVVALLVNKTATPELLPLSLLPACSTKGLPVVALEDLDKLWKKCIAIAFKASVQSPECCFHPLYQRMIQVTKKAAAINNKKGSDDDEDDVAESEEMADTSDDESALTKHDLLLLEEKRITSFTLGPNKSSSKYSNGRRQRLPPPVIDVSRHHLTRTRTDQRAFVPGVGMNKMAATDDTDLIMVATDVAGVGADTSTDGFDYRNSLKKQCGYQGKKSHRGQDSEAPGSDTLGGLPSAEDSSTGCQDIPDETQSDLIVPDLGKKSSDLMFQLDFDGEDSSLSNCADSVVTSKSSSTLPMAEKSKMTTAVKRKRSKLERTASYVPASVKRIVANAKRKKE